MSVETSNEQETQNKLRITLFENGFHSLQRGLESYNKYLENQDKMLLKESILFLNHGIELLMKRILINHDQFLIFEDLRKACKKKIEADKQKLDIFSLDDPPRTVTLKEAIERVEAFIRPRELTEDLKKMIEELFKLRNCLEHYEIDIDVNKVTQLLSKIHNPLLSLFKSQINEMNGRLTKEPLYVWTTLEESSKSEIQFESEITALMSRFNGQKVPGHFFNTDNNVFLPKFDKIQWETSFRILDSNIGYRVDIHGKSKEKEWIVEVKRDISDKVHLDKIIKYLSEIGNFFNAQSWIVSCSTISTDKKNKAKEKGIYITDKDGYLKLKNYIEQENK